MQSTTHSTDAETARARLVDAGMSPARVLLSGPELRDATTLWNAEVDRHPAIVVRCLCREDVLAAVRVATSLELPLSVLGGGHDWAGRALRDGGLVINLSPMRRSTGRKRSAISRRRSSRAAPALWS